MLNGSPPGPCGEQSWGPHGQRRRGCHGGARRGGEPCRGGFALRPEGTQSVAKVGEAHARRRRRGSGARPGAPGRVGSSPHGAAATPGQKDSWGGRPRAGVQAETPSQCWSAGAPLPDTRPVQASAVRTLDLPGQRNAPGKVPSPAQSNASRHTNPWAHRWERPGGRVEARRTHRGAAPSLPREPPPECHSAPSCHAPHQAAPRTPRAHLWSAGRWHRSDLKPVTVMGTQLRTGDPPMGSRWAGRGVC